MVFYRKYRPQKIKDLDSKDIRDKLYNVLESSSKPHAFLFTGPKGLGKTSTARIVAKALNCEKKPLLASLDSGGNQKKEKNQKQDLDIEPCNECYQCTSITNGTNLDILEIDGASNRGIDEIRDLREKIKLSPLNARIKVYIIDEVHMLTQEAFNALLKTLEEPPNHVVFILCTTEPHKVPATISSRCLQIQFKKATREELARSFERILKEESLKSEPEALDIIASLSDGSFRDGVKILEEMALISKDKKITKDLVEQKYQISSLHYQIAQMIRYLEDRDTKSALESIAKLTSDGVDMGYFIEEFIRTLHNTLLFKAGITFSEQSHEFKIENTKLEIGELKKAIELLSKAHGELKYAVLAQIPLEMAIIEWGTSQISIQRTSPPTITSEVKKTSSTTKTELQKIQVSTPPEMPKVTQQKISSYDSNDALWQALIDKVKSQNHSVAGVLRGCHIKSYDGQALLIETNFKFHKDKLSEMKTLGMLEKACRDITKKNVNISVVMKPTTA